MYTSYHISVGPFDLHPNMFTSYHYNTKAIAGKGKDTSVGVSCVKNSTLAFH